MRLFSVVLAMGALALPAHAQSVWTDSQWRTGAWQVVQSAPGSESTHCLMGAEFDVPGHPNQTFGFVLNEDDAYLLLRSDAWTTEKGTKYEDFGLTFYPSGDGFDGPATGLSNNGLSIKADHSLAEDLSSSHRLVVSKGDGDDLVIVADFNLEGSARAISAVRRCLAATIERERARIERENRNRHITSNPFAKSN